MSCFEASISHLSHVSFKDAFNPHVNQSHPFIILNEDGEAPRANRAVGWPKAGWHPVPHLGRKPLPRRSSSAILQRAAKPRRPSGLGHAPPLGPFTTALPQETRLASSFHSPSLERPSPSTFLFLQHRLHEARLGTPSKGNKPKTGYLVAPSGPHRSTRTNPASRPGGKLRTRGPPAPPTPTLGGLSQNPGRARVPPGRKILGGSALPGPARRVRAISRRPAWPWPRLELDPTYRERPRELSLSPRQAGPPAQTERPRVGAFPATTGRRGLGTLGRSPSLMWAGHLGPRS